MCINSTQKKPNNLLTIISFMLLSFTLFSLSACIGEHIAPIRIQNETSENLTIIINNASIGDAAAGATFENRFASYTVVYKIEAKNSQGKTIYHKKITHEDMERMNWKVIIYPQTEKMSSDNISESSDNTTGK